MKIAEINIVSYGSTGRIMPQLADVARQSGYIVATFSPVLFSKRKLVKKYQIVIQRGTKNLDLD